jgi:hypothetical protein
MLIDPKGRQVLGPSEVAALHQALVESACTPGLKKLIECENVHQAQLLWLGGEITAAEFTAFLTCEIANDVRRVAAFVENVLLTPQRPGATQH